jgi:hypothetical protein
MHHNNSDLIYPSFTRLGAEPGNEFEGPLFRGLDYDGFNASGQPLPRLLLEFFRAFNSAVDIWRERDPVFWAENRKTVVRIARNFVRDRAAGRHGILFTHYFEPLDEIVLGCGCCSLRGPCLLCEFNSHYIANLFKRQFRQIRASQGVGDVFKKFLPSFDLRYGSFPHLIAEYLVTPLNSKSIKRLTAITRKALFFVQNSNFAPEIKSIINRGQFNSWARIVRLNLLRPFAQPVQAPELILGVNWSLAAHYMRGYPATALDYPYTDLISLQARRPHFLEADDLFATLNPLNVRINRRRNQDSWEHLGLEPVYLSYDRSLAYPYFPESDVEQEFSEATEGSDVESSPESEVEQSVSAATESSDDESS